MGIVTGKAIEVFQKIRRMRVNMTVITEILASAPGPGIAILASKISFSLLEMRIVTGAAVESVMGVGSRLRTRGYAVPVVGIQRKEIGIIISVILVFQMGPLDIRPISHHMVFEVSAWQLLTQSSSLKGGFNSGGCNSAALIMTCKA